MTQVAEGTHVKEQLVTVAAMSESEDEAPDHGVSADEVIEMIRLAIQKYCPDGDTPPPPRVVVPPPASPIVAASLLTLACTSNGDLTMQTNDGLTDLAGALRNRVVFNQLAPPEGDEAERPPERLFLEDEEEQEEAVHMSAVASTVSSERVVVDRPQLRTM